MLSATSFVMQPLYLMVYEASWVCIGEFRERICTKKRIKVSFINSDNVYYKVKVYAYIGLHYNTNKED